MKKITNYVIIISFFNKVIKSLDIYIIKIRKEEEMKRILTIFFALILTLTLTSCNTSKTLEAEKKELTIKDVIDVKGVKVKINSITRKNEDCLLK